MYFSDSLVKDAVLKEEKSGEIIHIYVCVYVRAKLNSSPFLTYCMFVHSSSPCTCCSHCQSSRRLLSLIPLSKDNPYVLADMLLPVIYTYSGSLLWLYITSSGEAFKKHIESWAPAQPLNKNLLGVWGWTPCIIIFKNLPGD